MDDTTNVHNQNVNDLLIENNIIQDVPFNSNLIKSKILELNPKKFIIWFKKYFSLKYNINELLKKDDNFMKDYLSNVVNITKSDILYVPFYFTNKYDFGPMFHADYYLVEVDYELPEEQIKIRLSYSYCVQDIENLFKDTKKWFYENCDDEGSVFDKNFDDFIKDEIIQPSVEDDTDLYLYNIVTKKHSYAMNLIGIQYTKTDEVFEHSLLDYIKQENIDLPFYDYLESIDMNEDNYYGSFLFDVTSDSFLIPLLKDSNLFKFECISSFLIDMYTFDTPSFDVNEFTDYPDVLCSTQEYVFETICSGLSTVMNKTSKEILCDVYDNIFEKERNIENNDEVFLVHYSSDCAKCNDLGDWDEQEGIKFYLFSTNYLNAHLYIIDENDNTKSFFKFDIPMDYYEELKGFDETPVFYKGIEYSVIFKTISSVTRDSGFDCTIFGNSVFLTSENNVEIISFEDIVNSLEKDLQDI